MDNCILSDSMTAKDRLCELSVIGVNFLPKIMQFILKDIISPKGLKVKFKNRDLNVAFTEDENSVMSKLPNTANFTVSLCYKLLRYGNFIDEPTCKWGNIPDDTHVEISDDVLRILQIRNELIQKVHEGVSNDYYIETKRKMESIICRVDSYLESGNTKCLELYRSVCDSMDGASASLKILEKLSIIEVVSTMSLNTGKHQMRLHCARLSVVVIDVLPNILRCIIIRSNLRVSAEDVYNKCTNIRYKFDKFQNNMLVSLHSTKTYDSLDIPLLCKLIRLFFIDLHIRPPAHGWLNKPPPAAQNVGDDVERINILRNELAHLSSVDINEALFEDYFAQVESISRRIDYQFGTSFAQLIIERKTEDIDYEKQILYQNLLRELENVQCRYEKKPIKFYWGDTFETNVRNIRSNINDAIEEGKQKIRLKIVVRYEKDRDEAVRILNELTEEINRGLKRIEFIMASPGSIELHVEGSIGMFITDEELMTNLHSLMNNVLQLGVLDISPNEAIDVHLIFEEEHTEQSTLVSDSKEINDTSEIIIDFDVEASVFETEDLLTETLGNAVKAVMQHEHGNGGNTEISATILPLDIGQNTITSSDEGLVVKGKQEVWKTEEGKEHDDAKDIPDFNNGQSRSNNKDTNCSNSEGKYAEKGQHVDIRNTIGNNKTSQSIEAINIFPEEENYVRMNLLLLKVCPRAVRRLFDSEFDPSFLEENIKKTNSKIKNLKTKRVINQEQWNLLFPLNGSIDSKHFDVTLIIVLVRNLSHAITPPEKGYDVLPASTEKTPGSDLARIKYYRNFLAHKHDNSIESTYFKTAWKDISDAVLRLGGNAMKLECDQLMIKPLDMSSQEILRDLQETRNDIDIIKESLKLMHVHYTKVNADLIKLHLDHESLRMSCDLHMEDQTKTIKEMQPVIYERIQTSHNSPKTEQTASTKRMDQLSSDHEKLQKDQIESQNAIFELKSSYTSLKKSCVVPQGDTVPWNRREYIKSELDEWQTGNENYFGTRAAKHVLECIQEHSCVTITASSGVGKTATIRRVALEMAKEGYDILPLTDPKEIVEFCNPNKKTLFVIDNFCGTYSINDHDLKCWESAMGHIKQRIANSLTKIIVACRLQVYQDVKFESLSIFRTCVCNLMSKDFCLSQAEKQSIAELYLDTKSSEIIQYCELYDCFPLLCKLYSINHKLDLKDFFQNPFSVYEAEIDNLYKKGHFAKYCALALCVIFNNRLEEKWFTDEIDKEKRIIIKNICEACKLSRGTSPLILLDEIKSLELTFIKKERNAYKTLHDKIFDFLTYYFGQKIVRCLINNADIHVIQQRFVLYKRESMNQFIIVLPPDCHEMYIQRLICDWLKGRVRCVFMNTNMKIPEFRYGFLEYLEELEISLKRKLANICDVQNNDTVLSECCKLGDILLIKWCIEHGADVNQRNCDGASALVISAAQSNTEVVQVLLDLNADINLSTNIGESPMLLACRFNNKDIVKLLLDNKADINKCRKDGKSPLYMACRFNNNEIVKLLLDKNAEINKYKDDDASFLFFACQNNHIKIVTMLLDNNADINECIYDSISPLFVVCENNHIEIAKLLLDNKADPNKCIQSGVSPLFVACQNNHIEIVKLLLDNKADTSKCKQNGVSPLFVACENNHIEIAKLLLDNKADTNKCIQNGVSPMLIGCQNNFIEIVKLLLENKADIENSTDDGISPLHIACFCNNKEIVNILLKYKADINKCKSDGPSPLFIACHENHIEIAKLLLDNKADTNKCNDDGLFPLFIACRNNHIEIVKLLLDNKADTNKCIQNGVSPMLIACKNNFIEIVKLLLENKADIEKSTPDGHSPLHTACFSNSKEIVNVLLNYKADINKCKDDGASPLFIACQENHIEIATMLLDNNADINKCRHNGASPLLIACENNHIEIVKMLLQNETNLNKCTDIGISPLFIACQKNNIEIVKLLLHTNADINKLDNAGMSPVSIACYFNNMEILNLLLDNNADINKCNKDGLSPLYIACMKNNIEIVRILLDNKADINISSEDAGTPLHNACKRNHIEITKLLLEKNAEIDKRDNLGSTPLMIACLNNNIQIVELLLNNNADVNTCTYTGMSPLSAASMFNNIDIIKMLLRKGARYGVITSILHKFSQTFGIQFAAYMDEPPD